MAREKENIAVVSVLSGQANGKDIEREFRSILGSETWRWIARPMAKNKFLMKFPSAKMIKE
jgi:hypothetical protein